MTWSVSASGSVDSEGAAVVDVTYSNAGAEAATLQITLHADGTLRGLLTPAVDITNLGIWSTT